MKKDLVRLPKSDRDIDTDLRSSLHSVLLSYLNKRYRSTITDKIFFLQNSFVTRVTDESFINTRPSHNVSLSTEYDSYKVILIEEINSIN